MELALAGVDPEVLKDGWYKNKYDVLAGMWDRIVSEVLAKSYQQQVYRYADDGKLYSAPQYQAYYGKEWLKLWSAAPQEFRVAGDGVAYTVMDFVEYYPDSWLTKWEAAHTATQQRVAENGNVYSMQEFIDYYKE